MKDIKEYTISELRYEIWRRQLEKKEKESRTLPKDFYEYEETMEIKIEDESRIFHAYVDDGSEGFEYLIKVKSEDYHACDLDLLENTIKHEIIDTAIEGGYFEDFIIEEIQINEVGRYGLTILNVTVPPEKRNHE